MIVKWVGTEDEMTRLWARLKKNTISKQK